MCTETSPRISFSSDLSQSDTIVPIEQHGTTRRDMTLLDSNSDFEFSVCRNFDQDSYPADEIFSNGMILPFTTQDKGKYKSNLNNTHKSLYKYELPPLTPLPSPPPPPPPPLSPKPTKAPRKESGKDENTPESSASEADNRTYGSKSSFWSFKRSSSLKCDIKKSLVCSFPLLFRSNSTGSVSNSKRAMLKDLQKHNSQKQLPIVSGPRAKSSSLSSSSASSSVCCNVHEHTQKPPLKKNEHGGSVRISPVLSFPPPVYVSKFCFRSISKNPKDRKKKK